MLALTYLDTNSWLIEWADQHILLDPWLVGALTFGNAAWLFKAERRQAHPIPTQIDLILLSQGLEDHAHLPTLKTLDRAIPVVGSLNAAKVTAELGFTHVTALHHGETLALSPELEIMALPGSPIGPNLVENGYLLHNKTEEIKLYYEPHGYHAENLSEFAPLDVVITPLMDVKLPLLGNVIQGQARSLELAQKVQPQIMIPTAFDAGEKSNVNVTGLLPNLLRVDGSIAQFRAALQAKNSMVEVLEPNSGERFTVALNKVVRDRA